MCVEESAIEVKDGEGYHIAEIGAIGGRVLTRQQSTKEIELLNGRSTIIFLRVNARDGRNSNFEKGQGSCISVESRMDTLNYVAEATHLAMLPCDRVETSNPSLQ
jgi:hypothetical protein